MSKGKTTKINRETIEDIAGRYNNESDNSETKSEIPNSHGIVVDCLVLAVRSEPSIIGDIRSLIKVGSEVVINLELSTDDFYVITTNFGITGFCMKRFIKIIGG